MFASLKQYVVNPLPTITQTITEIPKATKEYFDPPTKEYGGIDIIFFILKNKKQINTNK